MQVCHQNSEPADRRSPGASGTGGSVSGLENAILLDAGHVGQNLHLACAALGLGTCMIAAYHQESIDALFGIDGREELVVYMAPVGGIPVDGAR